MEWNWIIPTATMLGIGAIGYFLKNDDGRTQKRKSIKRSDVDELKKELDDLRSDLPFIYTTREDFIRTMNNVDKKLDKIHDSMLGGPEVDCTEQTYPGVQHNKAVRAIIMRSLAKGHNNSLIMQAIGQCHGQRWRNHQPRYLQASGLLI
ncbi:hypothetical protein WDD9_006254 [Paenibacillus melissococcoides]|uniref:hypothetical protein n=1 Tax=Paenibacillus melissococcoides TaxID=2912268 RepID=UPI0021C27F09|nr:hypothetical protein [Paenibacillus melissococcoides]CAH8721367.1 hypothetical protein WDD9_006254 [Paenibacillus melissococcoides]